MMTPREKFVELLEVTGLTVDEVIQMEKNVAAQTLPTCTVDKCLEDWHWCSGCNGHYEATGECRNCD